MSETACGRVARPWTGRMLPAVGIGVMLGACTTSPEPDQMARTTLETAPADLQLLCAGEFAKSAGVDSSKVLPVSSRQVDAKSYQVELNAGGRPASCVIDTEGNIVSLTPA